MNLKEMDQSDIIEKFAVSPKDTASAQVQIALLTRRLQVLNDHFKQNKKDFHSRAGLLKLVGQRRRLLAYLSKKDFSAYKTLIGQLGIRK